MSRTAAPTTTSPRARPKRPGTRSMSRSTAVASWWCRPPAANATPATAAFSSTASGNQVLGNSGPIVFQPGDHDINVTPDGTITVVEGNNRIDSVRGKLRLVSFADAQKLLKEGSNLYSAGEGAAQPDTTS